MRILLINPPLTGTASNLTVLGLPLGILYIAAVLEKKGKVVEVFDSITCEPKLETKRIDNEKIHIGASWKRLEDEIRNKKPDIVGISNQFSSQVDNAIRAAEITKKIDARIITVVGGPHASCMPQDFLKKESIDFVVRGEGEYPFAELVNAIEKNKSFEKINNIAFKKEGKNIINPISQIDNLDELPFPTYHLLSMENYFGIIKEGLGRVTLATKHTRQISLITSRGCPYNCIFCSIHQHMGRKWRANSAEYVVRHIKYVVDNYAVNHISFEDDNLIVDKERFEKILDGIRKNNINITWDTPNGIRADRADFELLKRMKRSGCSSIKIGVESGDQHILNSIVGKNLELKKVVETASACKQLNIPVTAFFIIGFPGESKKSIKRTLDFAYTLKKKYYADSVITIAIPLIGTKMYDISKEKNYLVGGRNPSEFGGKDGLVIETENFNLDYLKRERNRFYKRVILLQILQTIKKPSTLLRYRWLLRNPKNFMNILSYLTKTK